MNQIEVQYQEILHILDRLLANLGLVLEDYDAEYLTQADLYIEIFKIMFPALEHALNADFGEDVTDEDIIQYLVNILAKDIIKMDLGHIKGELIAQGDAKSILNFLQLLLEISNMVDADKQREKEKKSKSKGNKKLIKSSGNSVDQSQGSSQSHKSSMEIGPKYHSAQGIDAEFTDSEERESNLEEQSAESYIDENGNVYYEGAQVRNDLRQNKAMYEQQQNNAKVNRTGPPVDSRSVSRISEVSKSKESSEYDKGTKKLSQKFDDFNVGAIHKRSDGGKPGSRASDEAKSSQGRIVQKEEEEQGEDELEEYEEEEQKEDEYGLQHDHGYTEESLHEHEGEEEEGEHLYMQEEEYIPRTGEDEVIEEGEDDPEGRDGETEDVEYYANDPINYPPMEKANWRRSYEAEKEDLRARNLPSGSKLDKQHAHEQEEEYYGHEEEEEEYEEQGRHGEQEEYEGQEEEEYEEQRRHGEQEYEGQEEEEEGQQVYDNGEYGEEEEGLPEGQEETEPREMNYVEPMEEVVEEHDEDNYDELYGNKRGQGRYEQEYANQAAEKVKGKAPPKTKSKAAGKKKKTATKAVDDYGRGKVNQRQLKPATAGMKVKKEKRSETKKSTARKSDESDSTSRSKKLVHSKSERNLNVAEEQEHSQDYSEDRGLQPKEYYEGERNQEEEGQEYQEGEQDYEGYEVHEEVGQIPDGNVFKILSDNVMRVKENLRENRAIEDIPFDDERTAKLIMQQKNQYKQYLQDFMKDHQLREKKYETMRQMGQKNLGKKMKSEKVKDSNMRKDFENQQKSLYFKMRDEKVNYLRRVHKTIFELEKRRIIEDKKEYVEFRTTRNKEAQNMIDSVKNEYKNKLSILREKNKNQQFERKVANEAQRAFVQAFEKELKTEQMKEVERIKNKWRYEKEKFDMMIKDEGFLERKIMELYKKGHF